LGLPKSNIEGTPIIGYALVVFFYFYHFLFL
jgi:hypothetical protein